MLFLLLVFAIVVAVAIFIIAIIATVAICKLGDDFWDPADFILGIRYDEITMTRISSGEQ